MVACRLMTSGDSGVSLAQSSVSRFCGELKAGCRPNGARISVRVHSLPSCCCSQRRPAARPRATHLLTQLRLHFRHGGCPLCHTRPKGPLSCSSRPCADGGPAVEACSLPLALLPPASPRPLPAEEICSAPSDSAPGGASATGAAGCSRSRKARRARAVREGVRRVCPSWRKGSASRRARPFSPWRAAKPIFLPLGRAPPGVGRGGG